ncbi:hypothetical protein J2Z40_001802 [Cytobacillus eiseniae]|uniref:DUF4397 domain-containing protein n=1 Tax=Cytobacillus eiseniae TaxID=762947 RepID=A0ABS4REB4_9BACI|nr:DUF4397 domain-containing protein [Cytobacillus eiseniae]MBP2241240.1 hypothetical protein [Cytobacillus eiseniae]
MPQNKSYFQKADMYDYLSNCYKYTDPNKYITYYKKHLKYRQLAEQSISETRLPEQNGVYKPALIRLIHASIDASEVDIYVNSIRVLKAFPYKEVSTYLPLPAGKYQIDIYPAGNMVSTVLSRKVVIEDGKVYSLIFSGQAKNLKWLAVEGQLFVPRGEAKLRFIHLSNDTPTVDIAVKDRDVIFSNVSYRKATSYLGLSPMNIDLEVRIAGSHNIALPMPEVQLEMNNIYTILLIGSLTDGSELEALMTLG